MTVFVYLLTRRYCYYGQPTMRLRQTLVTVVKYMLTRCLLSVFMDGSKLG